MNRIETYRHWIRIQITHEYYVSGALPLNLSPAKETKDFLFKSGILFRKYSDNQWNLLLPSADSAAKALSLWAEEIPVMKFELIPLSNDIFYNSVLNECNDGDHSIKKSVQPKTWRQLEIPFTDSLLQDQAQIQINIQSVKKHIELILIPKYSTIDMSLQLNEEKGRIEFDEIQRIVLLDDIDAYRFISREPIALAENSNYKIKLWERRKSGNRLLSDAIPLPRYDEISTINPNNTISTYFYY